MNWVIGPNCDCDTSLTVDIGAVEVWYIMCYDGNNSLVEVLSGEPKQFP